MVLLFIVWVVVIDVPRPVCQQWWCFHSGVVNGGRLWYRDVFTVILWPLGRVWNISSCLLSDLGKSIVEHLDLSLIGDLQSTIFFFLLQVKVRVPTDLELIDGPAFQVEAFDNESAVEALPEPRVVGLLRVIEIVDDRVVVEVVLEVDSVGFGVVCVDEVVVAEKVGWD